MPIISFQKTDPRHFVVTTQGNVALGVIACFDPDDKHTKAHVHSVFGEAERAPDLIFMLGDLVYHNISDDGVKSAKDLEKLQQLMSGLPTVPIFMAHGNHEGRIHGGRRKVGRKLEKAVWHTTPMTDMVCKKSLQHGWFDRRALEGWASQPQIRGQPDRMSKHGPYVRRTDGQWTLSHEPENPTIGIHAAQVNQFNMAPGGYYVVNLQDETGEVPHTDVIVVDSSTLPYDDEQADWLKRVINASKAGRIILMSHHALLTPTFGKRLSSCTDGKMYASAAAEFLAMQEADEREPTKERIKTLPTRQAAARRRVMARFEQLSGLADGLDHISILNQVCKEILRGVEDVQWAKVQLSVCAHEHHLELIGTKTANTLVVGGGMGGKLGKVEEAYGRHHGLLYGEKATGVAYLQVPVNPEDHLKGRLVAGLPHDAVGDALQIERATFSIAPNCNLSVSRRIENNLLRSADIQRYPGHGYIIQYYTQQVGQERRLVETVGTLKLPRIEGNQASFSIYPGPLETRSSLQLSLEHFTKSLNRLARYINLKTLNAEERVLHLLPRERSWCEWFSMAEKYNHPRVSQVLTIIQQGRVVHQHVLKRFIQHGPWQPKLRVLLDDLTALNATLKTTLDASGVESFQLTHNQQQQLMQQLKTIQQQHGQSYRQMKTVVMPAFAFVGLLGMFMLMGLAADVVFDAQLNLPDELANAGGLFLAVLLSQMVAGHLARGADRGLAAEVSRFIEKAMMLVKAASIVTEEESIYEDLSALEAGHRGCLPCC